MPHRIEGISDVGASAILGVFNFIFMIPVATLDAKQNYVWVAIFVVASMFTALQLFKNVLIKANILKDPASEEIKTLTKQNKEILELLRSQTEALRSEAKERHAATVKIVEKLREQTKDLHAWHDHDNPDHPGQKNWWVDQKWIIDQMRLVVREKNKD